MHGNHCSFSLPVKTALWDLFCGELAFSFGAYAFLTTRRSNIGKSGRLVLTGSGYWHKTGELCKSLFDSDPVEQLPVPGEYQVKKFTRNCPACKASSFYSTTTKHEGTVCSECKAHYPEII